MEGDVIKSFLVGLGFGVDDASLAKFNKAISNAAVKVTALYTSIQLSAAGIFASISKISSGFEEMGYQLRLVQPAVNKFLVLRQAMLSTYAAAGINLTQAVQQSIKFNLSLEKTKMALDAAYKSVGIKFLPMLTKQMDIFRSKIFANMPKIQEQLTKFVNFIFKAFQATIELGNRIWSILGRVWDFFAKLDEVTGGWSTKIMLAIAAWKFLNLAFLATPLGMILSGLLAIIALYDDFKVWQEGGKSLINWGSEATKIVIGLTAAVIALGIAFGAWRILSGIISALKAFNAVLAVTTALEAIMAAPFYAVAAAIGAVIAALTLADQKWNIFGGKLSGFFSGIGGKIIDFLGGGPGGQSVQNTGGGAGGSGVTGAFAGALQSMMNPQAIGTQSNSPVSHNINQETSISISGVSDAKTAGLTAASEQERINFNMARNMKGAIR